MQATARIFFQTAPAKRTKDNKCPVKICITHKGKRKYYSIVDKLKNNELQFLSEEDIEKVYPANNLKNPRGKYKDIRKEYDDVKKQAEDIIYNIANFSFNQFKDKWTNKIANWDNVFVAMIDQIKELEKENRLGYAESFKSTLRAIKDFHSKKTLSVKGKSKVNCRVTFEERIEAYISGNELRFVDITPSWLKNFERWMENGGKSKSTRGIYIRNLKVLFNLAINYHNVIADNPFRAFKPKTAQGRKIALSMEKISMIANYEAKDEITEFYRDIFMFSFLGCGMNLADIARLRYSNIVDGEIIYVRKKTENEEIEEEPVKVPVTSIMQSIIDKQGNRAIGHDAYIFPILKNNWNEKLIHKKIKEFTKQLNKYIGAISWDLGFTEKVTSYVARHSWATISKNSGKSIEFISEGLNHSSVNVTKKYLKSFEKSARLEHSNQMEDNIYNSNVG